MNIQEPQLAEVTAPPGATADRFFTSRSKFCVENYVALSSASVRAMAVVVGQPPSCGLPGATITGARARQTRTILLLVGLDHRIHVPFLQPCDAHQVKESAPQAVANPIF